MTATPYKSSEQNPLSIRTTSDMAAYAVHSLGYWPQESAVIIAAGARGTGPVLRINAPVAGISPEGLKDAVTRFVGQIPQDLGEGGRLRSFTVVLFGRGSELRSRQINPRTHQQARLEEIHSDRSAAESYLPWIPACVEASQAHKLHLGDILYIGDVSRWELSENKPEFTFSGLIEDIYTSDIYLSLVTHGSIVNPSQTHYLGTLNFNPQRTRDESERSAWVSEAQLWFSQYRDATEAPESGYCSNYLYQKYAEAKLWDSAISAVIDELNRPVPKTEAKEPEAYRGDRLRQKVPAHIAGYLAATLNSSASYQFLLFTAARSLKSLTHLMTALADQDESDSPQDGVTPPPLFLPLAEGSGATFESSIRLLNETPPSFISKCGGADTAEAELFGETLTGRSHQAPDWKRTTALEYLVALLEPVATEHHLGRILMMRAWISWFKGSTSFANRLYEQAFPLVSSDSPALGMILESDALPWWAANLEQCWRNGSWPSR